MKTQISPSTATESTATPRLALKKATLKNLNVRSDLRAGRAAANPRTDCVCHCNPT